jgi:hypothetical protein
MLCLDIGGLYVRDRYLTGHGSSQEQQAYLELSEFQDFVCGNVLENRV